MTRLKSIFAALLLTAIVGIVPQAQAQTVKIVIAGSSAMWQEMALAAYKGNATEGLCVSGGTAPCFHYTAKNFNLSDTRPTVKGGQTAVDQGNIWVVWDSNTISTNVWVYIRVDSGRRYPLLLRSATLLREHQRCPGPWEPDLFQPLG